MPTQQTPTLDRSDYRNENGLAAWWSKDGAWHVARWEQDGAERWTHEAYDTREQAIAALAKEAA